MTGPARVDAARERVLAEHRDVLEATLDAADTVAADPSALSDGEVLRRRFRERLADRGLLAQYPGVLETAVDATGLTLVADPVPAPPYVVVASRGPLCRATTADGRLVLAVRAFAVDGRDAGGRSPADRRYDRTSSVPPEDTLEVTLR